MNTYQHQSYRVGGMLFLVTLLTLALIGHQHLSSLLAALNHAAVEPVTVQQPATVQAAAPALLLLNADALVLTTESGATQVTARVRDAEGKPVAGVAVQFASAQGSLSPATAATDGEGTAKSTFTAGGSQGQALIKATVNGLTSDAAVQIVKPNNDAAGHTLALEFSPGKLDHGQQANLGAALRDASGQPVVGELVSLFGSLGEITPASAMSDANGRVMATYRAGTVAGPAMITALAGYASQSVTFQVGNPVTPPSGSGDQHSLYLPLVTR